MRKVEIKGHERKDGVWQTVVRGEALFHEFGLDVEEGDGGFASFSVAIVEWPDGSLEPVAVCFVRFLEPTK